MLSNNALLSGVGGGGLHLPGLNPIGTAKRSLNRDARKRELLKITMENQAILRRLQEQ
jgi:hypothetical protein